MIPDSFSKTVSIPIKIINGHPSLYPEGKLPTLKEGTIGDLIVPAFAFEDAALADQFNKESTEPFLPAGTKLVVEINPDCVPKELKETVLTGLPLYCGTGVEVILVEELNIRRRGTKAAQLESCPCKIPSLQQTALSVNHAYTLISQAYEPNRRSHSGNVFTKVFYRKETNLLPLKKLRGY